MANLTPQQLAQLQAYYAGNNSGYIPDAPMTMDGQMYQAYDPRNTQGGFLSYDPNATGAGEKFSKYDGQGGYTGEGQFKSMAGLDPLLLAFLAAAGGMAFGLPGMAGAESAGAGAAGAGFETMAPMQMMEMPGGFLPEFGAAGAGAGAGALGTMGTLSPMSTEGLGAGMLTPMATSAAKVGLGSMGGLLGPAATALGGVAGAQGNNQSATQDRKMDPRLDPFYFGQNGVLPMAQGLLQQQIGPGGMAQMNALRGLSTNLLSTPMQRTFAMPRATIGGR